MDSNLIKETFTVIIPIFNCEKTIEECVTSVLNQRYSVSEIILIDDGSTDRTPKILKEKFLDNPKIKYIHQQNRGVSSARNLGIKNAKSQNVMFLDADDYWLPNKVELHIKHLQNHSECSGSFTDFYLLNERLQLQPNAYKNLNAITTNNLLLNLCRINGSASSFVCKRELINKLRGFKENYTFGEDLDFWINFSELNNICEIKDYGVVIRSNSRKYFSSLRKNEWKISNLYFALWNDYKLDLDSDNSKITARNILRIDLRKNALNPSYVLWRFPLLYSKKYPKIFNSIYKNLLGYFFFLIKDIAADAHYLLRRLRDR